MKKYEIYVFVLFSFIIINYVSVAEWQKDGELEWLNISNSAIKQYVFSQDGKSIYVLDSSNVFFKYDIETGKMLWIKNLTSAKYGNYTFDGAKISEDADYYLVWFVKDNSLLHAQMRDIEKDNVKGSFSFERTYYGDIYDYPKYYRYYTFISISKLIVYLEWDSGPFYPKNPYNNVSGNLGNIKVYKIQNDSILFTRNLQDK